MSGESRKAATGSGAQRLAHCARRHHGGAAEARDRGGGPGGIRDRRAGLQALGGQALEHIAAHGGFTAEQMGAARDVEHQAVGRIEADQRRITVAPVGDAFKQAPVRLLVARRDGQRRIHGARIGERHADPQAEPVRRVIHGHDAQRALDRAG